MHPLRPQLECELELAKRREQQLMEQKHLAEAKYRQAVLRGMSVTKVGRLRHSDTARPRAAIPERHNSPSAVITLLQYRVTCT